MFLSDDTTFRLLQTSETIHVISLTSVSADYRVHRVATAAFWRTFSDEGNPSWLVRVGGARPPPLITFTLTSKVAVYAPPDWEDTLTLFHLYQYMYSVARTIEDNTDGVCWEWRGGGGGGFKNFVK